MRTIASVVFTCILAVPSIAQQAADTSSWKHSIVTGFTGTQVSYTDWSQGGENALSWTVQLDGKSTYDLPSISWMNNYKLAYGNTKLGVQGTRKTDDKIDLESSLTFKMGTYINPYVAATMKTQFTTGYSYAVPGVATAISDFFDPAYLTQSAGVGYQPVPEVKTRLGAALREILTDRFRLYADGERTKVEGGLESVTEVDTRVVDNVVFKAKLELFAAFKTFDKVVVRSDNTLAAKVNDFISTTLNVQLIQEPTSPFLRTQVKQTLALSVSFVLI